MERGTTKGRGGGARQVLSIQKGVGGRKRFSHAKRGGGSTTRFWAVLTCDFALKC